MIDRLYREMLTYSYFTMEVEMDQKTTGIIATLVAVVLCGCPGLFGLCFGATFAWAGLVPGSQIDIFGSSDPRSAMTMGIVSLCLGVVFVAIPIVVGFLTLRKKKPAEPVSNEPLPPAI